MKRKIRLKKKFVIFLSTYLVLLISIFAVQTYSKYTDDIDVEGNPNIAKWDVSANIPNATITVEPCGEESYNISVTSDSDVALTYSINLSNVSKYTLISLDDEMFSKCDTSYTFSNVGTINVTDTNKTKNHTLKFITTPEVTEATNRNVKIEVVFTQKKPS